MAHECSQCELHSLQTTFSANLPTFPQKRNCSPQIAGQTTKWCRQTDAFHWKLFSEGLSVVLFLNDLLQCSPAMLFIHSLKWRFSECASQTDHLRDDLLQEIVAVSCKMPNSIAVMSCRPKRVIAPVMQIWSVWCNRVLEWADASTNLVELRSWHTN